MAESPTGTIEAPSAPAAGQEAGLDTAITQMEARLFPRGGQSTEQAPGAADASSPATTAPPEQPTPDGTVPEPSGNEDLDEGQDTSVPGQPKASRSKRLSEQLAHADQRASRAEQQLQQRLGFEQDAYRQFVDLVLPDQQFEELRAKAEGGDWEAKQQLDQARTWRRMVAPIADLAHAATVQQFNQDLAGLRSLDGMDAEGHQRLLAAATPGDKLKTMWQLARKASDDGHKERIAELEAEVQALKTNRAANGAQPAHGGAPGNTATGLAGLVGRDGQLTEEAVSLSPSQIRQRFLRAS